MLLKLLFSLAFIWGANSSPPDDNEPITRDVVVIGGGSAGTYAAIALRDAGVSVVVIEKENRLGGHANTYTDPASELAVDYGVVALGDIPVVHDYFARLSVTPLVGQYDPGNISFFDFKTGLHSPDYVRQDPAGAIKRYQEQLAKYPFLEITYDLPDEIPDDLLMPWGDFCTKFSLGSMSRETWQWAQGYGNVLDLPAVYIIKFLSQRWVDGVTGTGFVFTSTFNFSSIYGSAAEVLGDDVLYGSTVLSTDRDKADHEGYHSIVVTRGTNNIVIRAKKIIVAIPPLTGNDFLGPLDLDDKESEIFGKFKHFNYWTAGIKEPAIPAGLNIQNVSPGNLTTPYSYPDLPAAYFLRVTTAPENYIMTYGTPAGVEKTNGQVKHEMLATLKRLRDSGYYGNIDGREGFRIVAFDNHSPYELNVDAEDIRNGFYHDLYALQGRRNTWYSGAAWVSHDSSAVWNYTAQIVQDVVKALS
ncbi:hypothetical protein GGR57DRAFT_377613 [Xylariaceae sp. FL1272]|nr:hypothetical protein GGR57DRAFT_377613 [Xylariaceae sp. FL1272]